MGSWRVEWETVGGGGRRIWGGGGVHAVWHWRYKDLGGGVGEREAGGQPREVLRALPEGPIPLVPDPPSLLGAPLGLTSAADPPTN